MCEDRQSRYFFQSSPLGSRILKIGSYTFLGLYENRKKKKKPSLLQVLVGQASSSDGLIAMPTGQPTLACFVLNRGPTFLANCWIRQAWAILRTRATKTFLTLRGVCNLKIRLGLVQLSGPWAGHGTESSVIWVDSMNQGKSNRVFESMGSENFYKLHFYRRLKIILFRITMALYKNTKSEVT